MLHRQRQWHHRRSQAAAKLRNLHWLLGLQRRQVRQLWRDSGCHHPGSEANWLRESDLLWASPQPNQGLRPPPSSQGGPDRAQRRWQRRAAGMRRRSWHCASSSCTVRAGRVGAGSEEGGGSCRVSLLFLLDAIAPGCALLLPCGALLPTRALCLRLCVSRCGLLTTPRHLPKTCRLPTPFLHFFVIPLVVRSIVGCSGGHRLRCHLRRSLRHRLRRSLSLRILERSGFF